MFRIKQQMVVQTEELRTETRPLGSELRLTTATSFCTNSDINEEVSTHWWLVDSHGGVMVRGSYEALYELETLEMMQQAIDLW